MFLVRKNKALYLFFSLLKFIWVVKYLRGEDMSQRKRNRLIIFTLVLIACTMVVAYAAFQTELTIKSQTNISSKWDIKIIGASVKEEYGAAENIKNTYDDLTANLEANLYSKGDYVLYEITVQNGGTFAAKLDNIGITNNSSAVKVTNSGFDKGQVLNPNTTDTLTVKIEYNPEYIGDASGTSGETKLDLTFVQNK